MSTTLVEAARYCAFLDRGVDVRSEVFGMISRVSRMSVRMFMCDRVGANPIAADQPHISTTSLYCRHLCLHFDIFVLCVH